MNENSPEWLSLVREKVETLRYGVVQIVVHDSRVTQIERTEKTRIESREISRFYDRPDKLEEPQPAERCTGLPESVPS
jgi:hypothetical protein